MSDDNKDKDKGKGNPHKYIGNNIPFFLKFAWATLILWMAYYFISYVVPDWQLWMKK